jgi:tetratricopeptide (TPR) repeat protein
MLHRDKDPGVVWIDGDLEYRSDRDDGRIHEDQIITRETLLRHRYPYRERENMKLSSVGIILFLFLVSCGCIFPGSWVFEKNQSRFADEVRASQSYYDSMVREDPLNATAWCLRGNYYNNAFNQFNTALQSYNRSLELDPEYGYAWFSKGVTLQNMKQYDEAETCFEKALHFDPKLGPSIAHITR